MTSVRAVTEKVLTRTFSSRARGGVSRRAEAVWHVGVFAPDAGKPTYRIEKGEAQRCAMRTISRLSPSARYLTALLDHRLLKNG